MATITPLMRDGHWTQIAVALVGTGALLGDMGLYLSADSTEAEIGIILTAFAYAQVSATRLPVA